jgi:hypothetical protein
MSVLATGPNIPDKEISSNKRKRYEFYYTAQANCRKR